MQRNFRLTRSEDFERVRRSGRSFSHPMMVLVARPSELEHIRVGVVAGRAVGNAIARNRAKRRLREAVRAVQNTVQPGWDIILIARLPLLASASIQVMDALKTLLRRAGMVPAA
ncbi:MAG TPA: ribonuclease P protein component [Anaerolineales bacterium]|nr:ribonuclease P protein component [Anaerolineales bacterium]